MWKSTYHSLTVMAALLSMVALGAAETKKIKSSTPRSETSLKDTSRTDRLRQTYVLQNRANGHIVRFSHATMEEVITGLQAANISVSKWHNCESKKTNSEVKEIVEDLELKVMLQQLGKTPQAHLNDTQIDYLKTVSPCDPFTRNQLKALSIILRNYQLIDGPVS